MLCVRATQPGGDGDTLPTDKSTASCRAGPGGGHAVRPCPCWPWDASSFFARPRLF